MLLAVSTTRRPATDLGYLLHKHPDRVQSFELSFGRAHVFYPEATDERTTVALLLDVDPIGLVRGARGESFTLDQYVNDRPYVASSFLSVAIAQVFGSALGGRCKDRPDVVGTPLPLEARLASVPCRAATDGTDLLRRLFEPLGYTVEATRHPLDPNVPDWGESPYVTLTLRGTVTLAALLSHLYVLIPVLDNDKHYWVGDAEVEKLLKRGEGWLAAHPERALITTRYLRYQRRLAEAAIARLTAEDDPDPDQTAAEHAAEEETAENRATGFAALGDARADAPSDRPLTLNEQRHGAVIAALKAAGARSVLDLGCGEGKLLRSLLRDPSFERLCGVDVSHRALQVARERLRLDDLPDRQRRRVELLHGSLMYHDDRLAGYDAAAVVEVIEHLDQPRLAAFERVLFEFARPATVVLTTPNAEYNVKWESLPAGQFRHRDHRFEWTRAQFREWAERVSTQFGFAVRFVPVGPDEPNVGSPTQMGVFSR